MKKIIFIICLSFLATITYSQSKTNEYSIKFNQKSEKFKSIQPIIDATKNKTIVALGEGTHGTKEFNIIRSDISKELIQKHNFRIIAFEGAFGDSYFLNKGINSDQDIKKVMKEYLLSIWQTKEFENLFKWIRNYNKSTQDKIIISGFDVNYLANSTVILENNNLKNNEEYSSLVKILQNKATIIDNAWTSSNDSTYIVDMKNLIKSGTEGYRITRKVDSIFMDKLDIDSKLSLKNLELGFENFYRASKEDYNFDRDSAMAENIINIQQLYNKKMIVVAHNGHISNKPTLITGMGVFLKTKYKDKYYALATFSSEGTYSAMKDNIDTKNNKFSTYNFPPILNNSWELEMNKSNLENFFVSFKEEKNNYYNTSLRIRFIGYTPITSKNDKYTITKPIKLYELFDGFIFIKNSNASEHF